MIYLGIAVAILVGITYWAATQLHYLMKVRQEAHELPSASGAD